MAKQTIYKLFLITKRNPELTQEQYVRDYEDEHAPYCAQMMQNCTRYYRRYVSYYGAPHSDIGIDFDSITECWFETPEDRQAMADIVAKGRAHDAVPEREAHMFDLPLIRVAMVDEEYDSMDDKFIHADRTDEAN